MSDATNTMTPETAFPSGIPIPAKLKALADAVNAGTLDPYDLSGSFELHFQAAGEIALWFARTATPSVQYAAAQLACFGCGPDGSIFAIWKAPAGGFPVVYLDSEGDSCVLATDFDQFLRLQTVDEEDSEDSINPDFQAWVQAQGLDIPETDADIVTAAALAHPDFSGWCDEAVEGTLSAETAQIVQTATPPKPQRAAASQPPADADLWTLMVAAIGERIDSPAVSALIQAVGAKPLMPGTVRYSDTSTSAKAFGIDIFADCDLTNRAYWPIRKEGRICVTYVTRILLMPPYSGPLPYGLGWTSNDEALAAVGQRSAYTSKFLESRQTHAWELPSPREELCWLNAWTTKGLLEKVALGLLEETDYITTSAEYEKEMPLVDVEDAFFAAWCALNGLLRPDRFPPDTLTALRERRVTPLQFLNGPCERRLWSGDIKPEFQEFISDYYRGLWVPDSQRWITDIKTVFGGRNCHRSKNEAMTQDTWENFDRIAPHIARRLGQWQRGELKPSEP